MHCLGMNRETLLLFYILPLRNSLGILGTLLDICVYMYKWTSCFPQRKGSKRKACRGDQGQGQCHCSGRWPQSCKGRTRHLPLSRNGAAGEAGKDPSVWKDPRDSSGL